MTRFARGGVANKKQPLEGSSWGELTSKKKIKPKETNVKVSDKTKEAQKSAKTSSKPAENEDQQMFKKTVKTDKSVPHQQRLSHMETKTQKNDNKFRANRGKQELKERQRERRRQKRKHDRDMEKVCYNCREPGHHLANCPLIKKDQEQGTGICFKCGSTEHSSSSCRVKVPPGVYPFAKCFICGEKGHITKQCPDNPRGLYPKGGCCKECGSVEHFRRDCPELQKQQGTNLPQPYIQHGEGKARLKLCTRNVARIQSITLETLGQGQSVDAQGDNTEGYLPVAKKKKKVVNF